MFQLIQRQMSPSLRTLPSTLHSNKKGYGDPSQEYWIGSEALTWMLNETSYLLRVSLKLENSTHIDLDYLNFSLTSVPSDVLNTLASSFRGFYFSSEYIFKDNRIVLVSGK